MTQEKEPHTFEVIFRPREAQAWILQLLCTRSLPYLKQDLNCKVTRPICTSQGILHAQSMAHIKHSTNVYGAIGGKELLTAFQGSDQDQRVASLS